MNDFVDSQVPSYNKVISATNNVLNVVKGQTILKANIDIPALIFKDSISDLILGRNFLTIHGDVWITH